MTPAIRSAPRRRLAAPPSGVALLAALLVALAGCAAKPPLQNNGRRDAELALGNELRAFSAASRSLVDRVALADLSTRSPAEIDARTTAHQRLTQRFDLAGEIPNRGEALVYLWRSAEMLRLSAKEGAIRETFGDDADEFEKGAEAMVRDLERLAEKYIGPKRLPALRSAVMESAKEEEALAVPTAPKDQPPSRPASRNLFADMLTLPLSPFTAARSVESGVGDVVLEVQQFNREFQRLPERTRVQAEQLLDGFYRSPLATATIANMNAIGESSRALAATAEALPQQLREQAAILLEESDAAQERLRQTISEARETAIAVDAALTNLGAQSRELDGTIREATAAAAAWERTADSVQQVLRLVREIQGDDAAPTSPATADGDPDFSFAILDESARQLQGAATEVAAALDRVLLILDDSRTEAVGALAEHSIASATAAGLRLVDAIFWRTLAVVGLAGAGLVAAALVRARPRA